MPAPTVRSTLAAAVLSSLLLALSAASAAAAQGAALVPPVASVDDPRAQRERLRVSYLFFDDGVASYGMRPRVREPAPNEAAGEQSPLRSTSLLAFPSAPEPRVVPAAAFDGLAAAAALDAGGLSERAPLLPATSADPEVVVLERSLDAVTAWAKAREIPLEERVLSEVSRLLAEGWTLVGVSAPSPAPPVGFRFRAERPTLPPDLLAAADEQERLFLVTRAAMTPSGVEGASVVKRLPASELASKLEGGDADLLSARRLLLADAAASSAGVLVLESERQDAALLDVSKHLELSSPDVAPLLPSPPAPAAAVGEPSDGGSVDDGFPFGLTVLEGDLRDEGDAAAVTTFSEVPHDEERRPLVRRFEDNRIFQLLQKVWD